MIKRITNGKALWCDGDQVWIAKGLNIFKIDSNGKRLTRVLKIGNFFERLFSHSVLIRQTLRIGIHHLLVLKNGDLFVSLKRKCLVLDKTDYHIKNVFCGFLGNKPGHQGICLDDNGCLYFAEYALNNKRDHEICIYKSNDNGIHFSKIYIFEKGLIRHIHFIHFDSYEKCLWLGTGDSDEECNLYKSIDCGKTWIRVGGDNQMWRAIGVCVTKDYLYWGTDAGHVENKNYLLKFDKKKGVLKTINCINSPCHGSAVYSNNQIFLSTGIEGGKNETDKYARIYKICENDAKMIFSIKKNCVPYFVQYGVIRFPLNTSQCSKVYFTELGLRHGQEKVCLYYEEE